MRRLLILVLGALALLVALAAAIEWAARSQRGREVASSSTRIGRHTVVASLLQQDRSLYAAVEWRRISFLSDRSIERLVATDDPELARALGHLFSERLTDGCRTAIDPDRLLVHFDFSGHALDFDLRSETWGEIRTRDGAPPSGTSTAP